MRYVILDTETTGLAPKDGHRIIEIGCVEMVDRRIQENDYHQYINPDREIDTGALAVHGISSQFLRDKPRFSDVVDAFIDYVKGSTLIIHNAPFDVGFINHELNLLSGRDDKITDYCEVIDTLAMARDMHPGQRNSLDALCKRYGVDNAHRELHGALLDSEILARVYLAMTGGQANLFATSNRARQSTNQAQHAVLERPEKLTVLMADEAEQAAHDAYLRDVLG
ncbi:MAG: DNA polymerase III subunit epsilon [marine bacterium B5-7]|nr:MAG: DNA polymerase III subunit epsilon [marine bacterium B5-7]